MVIGIGGSYLGSRAAIELLQGTYRNVGRGKGDPQIFFAGNTVSTRSWNELIRLLKDKDFSVIVISKSGTTTEPAVAFRALRWMMERKYGTKAKERISVATVVGSPLHKMGQEEGYELFPMPRQLGGCDSALTAAALVPMAVAGIARVARG